MCIALDLRQKIMSGELTEGDRIPTEKELAETYDVSVLTVRQAQKILVEQGLIDKQQGRGTFVTSQSGKRKVMLICGLANQTEPDLLSLSPYFQNSIRFCREKAAAAGIEIETVWQDSSPVATEAANDIFSSNHAFIFIGCTDGHFLLSEALDRGLNLVTLGKIHPGPKSIWFDPQEATRVALTHFPEGDGPIFAVGSTTMDTVSGAFAETQGRGLIPLNANVLPFGINWEYERQAYVLVRSVCGNFSNASYLFLDDILARGGTRALLENGSKPEQVVVVCGRQEVFPLGLPVTYITHDTALEAEWAVDMLTAQMDGNAPENECRQSPYRQDDVTESELLGAPPSMA